MDNVAAFLTLFAGNKTKSSPSTRRREFAKTMARDADAQPSAAKPVLSPDDAWRRARQSALRAFRNPNKPEGAGEPGFRRKRHRKLANKRGRRKAADGANSKEPSLSTLVVDGVEVQRRRKCQHVIDQALEAADDHDLDKFARAVSVYDNLTRGGGGARSGGVAVDADAASGRCPNPITSRMAGKSRFSS